MRQCDTTLPFDWHDDPQEEVHALLQNLLRNALSALVFLVHFIVAFSHLLSCPCFESVIFRELFPIA